MFSRDIAIISSANEAVAVAGSHQAHDYAGEITVVDMSNGAVKQTVIMPSSHLRGVCSVDDNGCAYIAGGDRVTNAPLLMSYDATTKAFCEIPISGKAILNCIGYSTQKRALIIATEAAEIALYQLPAKVGKPDAR